MPILTVMLSFADHVALRRLGRPGSQERPDFDNAVFWAVFWAVSWAMFWAVFWKLSPGA